MIRSPHRALEVLRTSPPVLPRRARLPRFSANQLDRAFAPSHRDLEVPVARFMTVRAPESVAVRVPIVNRAPARIEHVRPRARTVAHVPPLPAQRRYPVASLDLSRPDVALPYGIGRYVNAATLKAIAGGGLLDRLLKNTPAGWEFVPNHTRIDLQDNAQEFRLGKLTIFS